MFKGVFAPIITTFDNVGNIDFKANELVINSLIDGGVNGILFLGSTGEFFSMSMNQKKEFIRFAIKTVNKRVPVLVGTGGTIVEEVVELTKFVESEGADAAVVVCPYYFKLDNESIYEYYAKIAGSVELPIILYNFPDRTAVNLEPSLILKLAKEFKNIIGIKDTVDGMSHTRKVINTVKSDIQDFVVFSGYDEYFIPNLLAGGNGIIGGLVNIVPELFARLYSAYNKNDLETVALIQKEVNKLMAIYDIAQVFIPVLKKAIQLTGKNINTATASPLGTLSDKQIEEIKKILS